MDKENPWLVLLGALTILFFIGFADWIHQNKTYWQYDNWHEQEYVKTSSLFPGESCSADAHGQLKYQLESQQNLEILNMDENAIEFDKDINNFKVLLEEFIDKWYGPKCPDYEETCICCQIWKNYEKLTKNVFID